VIVGVDGCRAGWLCVAQEAGSTAPIAWIALTFLAVLERHPLASCIAVDIPIGLPGTGSRGCDVAAREIIKPRSSSVFPAPIRGVLHARSYDEANATHKAISGKGMTKQSFAILPKIAEVDAALRGDPELRKVVFEVHPEVSFRVWGGAPMLFPKRSAEGEAIRAKLVEEQWPGALDTCAGSLRRTGGWEEDDLIDAFAALWTARRIVAGTARTLPETPEVDGEGLPMRMLA